MNYITGPQGQEITNQTEDGFDLAPYRDDLADLNLTAEQESELLTTLYSILQTFVRLGFDIGLADPCGQIFNAVSNVQDKDTTGVECPSATASTAAQQEEDTR